MRHRAACDELEHLNNMEIDQLKQADDLLRKMGIKTSIFGEQVNGCFSCRVCSSAFSISLRGLCRARRRRWTWTLWTWRGLRTRSGDSDVVKIDHLPQAHARYPVPWMLESRSRGRRAVTLRMRAFAEWRTSTYFTSLKREFELNYCIDFSPRVSPELAAPELAHRAFFHSIHNFWIRFPD